MDIPEPPQWATIWARNAKKGARPVGRARASEVLEPEEMIGAAHCVFITWRQRGEITTINETG